MKKVSNCFADSKNKRIFVACLCYLHLHRDSLKQKTFEVYWVYEIARTQPYKWAACGRVYRH